MSVQPEWFNQAMAIMAKGHTCSHPDGKNPSLQKIGDFCLNIKCPFLVPTAAFDGREDELVKNTKPRKN